MNDKETFTVDEVWSQYANDKDYATKSYSQFAKENDWVMIKATAYATRAAEVKQENYRLKEALRQIGDIMKDGHYWSIERGFEGNEEVNEIVAKQLLNK